MTIGWIGTGNMGVRMAERLVRAGHKLYVYNRTKSKAQRVLDAGDAVLLNSPGEIAAECDIFFTSITNDDSMREVLHGKDGLLSRAREGQILVEMSTLSAAFSAEIRETLHSKGLLYLDAPVVGSMFMIEQGLLKVLTSGDEAAYQAALPYLQDIGRTVVPLGGEDQARCMKIAVNMMICSYLTMYSEVLLVGEGMGFGWKELNDLLESSDGASSMLRDKGTTHRERVWESATALTSTAMKDLGLALEMAEQRCFPLPLTAIICQYDRYMHSSGKYDAYSTFGTVGVLEDWCGKKAGDYMPLSEERRDELSKALTTVLVGVTTLLAAEALLFCHHTGIEQQAAVECLGSCHGASAYFKNLCAEQAGPVAVADVRNALHAALKSAKEAGLFVPILATANEQLNRFAAGLEPDADLSAILAHSFVR